MKQAINWRAGLYFLLLILGLSALALWVTFPEVSSMRTFILGGGEMGEWLWHYWAMKVEAHSIHKVQGLWPSLYHFIVSGRPRLGNTTDLWMFSWPLEQLFSCPVYYNLKCQLVLVLNALGAYALVWHLTRRRSIAILAAIFWGFNPFTLYLIAYNRVREAILFCIPLYILYFMRSCEEERDANAVWAGVWLGLTAIFYWFYLLYLAIFSLSYLLYQGILHLRAPRWNWGLGFRLLLLFSLAWFIIFPVAQPWIQEVRTEKALYETAFWMDFPSLKQYQALSPTGLWRGLISQGSLRQTLEDSQSLEYPVTAAVRGGLPVILIVLALMGLALRFKTTVIFWLNAAFFYLLSLGPYLKYQDNFFPAQDPLRLPYNFFWKYLPLLSRLFHPNRAAVIVIICLIIAASLGLHAFFERFKFAARLRQASVVMLLLLFFVPISSNRILPVASTEIFVPRFYRELAAQPSAWIIELPMETPDRVMQKSNLFYQTIHEHSIVEGWGEGSQPQFARNEFVKFLYALNTMTPPARKVKASALAALRQAGVKYIIVHESGGQIISRQPKPKLYGFIKQQLKPYLGPPLREEIERPPFVMPDETFRMAIYKL